MIRRIFGRKKDEDEEEVEETKTEEKKSTSEDATESEPVESEEQESPRGAESPVEDIEIPSSTMPYHDTIQNRLLYLFTEPEFAEYIEAPDEFLLEFMAMGERFAVLKKSMENVEISSGAVPDEDAFIRIGNDVVDELLSASNFDEFSDIYLKYYKNPEPGKFVKIEMRKAITALSRKGYNRVPALKLLIGATR